MTNMPLSLIRHALRRLWRDRAVTFVALAVLALGIGANTALFTVVNAVLLKPLPYPAADRLVSLRLTDATFRGPYASVPVNAAHDPSASPGLTTSPFTETCKSVLGKPTL